MENLGKRLRTTDSSITKRIQGIQERISGIEDTIEDTDTMVKENTNQPNKQPLNSKHPGNPGQ
jgi:archaellum component FlaC